MSSHFKRHIVIPDTQIKPGDDTTHLDWAAEYIVEHKPDAIIHIGDHWDMPSLSMHDGPGSKQAEGARVHTDIEAGNAALGAVFDPVHKEMARIASNRRKRWLPRLEFFMGNHEDRITRAIFLVKP